jgi:TolB-like protein
VLPFTISGQSGSQDAFADGLSAELTDALNRIGGLHVLAPTSSSRLRDRPIAATEVARRLNVGAVLEGSIARDGARISMVAELVDAGTGFTLWSHRYDIESANLLDAQANIAEAVAASLQGTLANGHPVAAAGGTHNEAAYDLYLRGLQYARDATDEPARQTARASFEAAIALDPTFALARAWRAREMAAIVYAGTATPAESQPLLAEARAEADRALALAPDLGLAHLALAEIAKLQQNFPEAQREISLAREDAPNDIQVLTDAVLMEVEFGHPEAARKLAELGVSLDPLSPSVYTALGYAQWVLRDYDGARASLRHARLLGTNTPHTGMIEAVVALDQGDNQEAEEVCAHRVGGWMGDLCSAVAEHRLGHASEAELHFAALRNSLGMSGAFHYAEVYAQWSQSAEALKWLDVAYRTHGAALAMMKTDSLLEPIRKMPQFAAIERRLRYPP